MHLTLNTITGEEWGPFSAFTVKAKVTITLANGYSSESTHRELSNEYSNKIGFRWFSEIFASLCFRQKQPLSIARDKGLTLT